jgi:hypothetical protein
VLFRKSLLTLQGVLASLSPGFSADGALAFSLARRLAGEWPERMAALPFARGTPTLLSNADLMLPWLDAPALALRWLRIVLSETGSS